MATNVLNEIFEWSLGRPPWQRDALRRLVTTGALDQNDVDELSQLCKSRHGLGKKISPIPLAASHLPQPGAERRPVQLQSLVHHAGVNALAQDQKIQFGPSLTVVYGANAAGKSGYTRILKRACRARGAEDILGNVVSGGAPGRPSATIDFRVGDEPGSYLWDDNKSPNTALSRVSVFDHHCASVYISKRTDVAFRPMGLDLFDRLSDASEAVKKVLEKERNSLESQRLPALDVAQGTAVHELVTNLTSLTDPTVVQELASLSEAQTARSEELRKLIRDLESDDPAKAARSIEFRANRLRALATRVRSTRQVLSEDSVGDAFAARGRNEETQHIVDELRRTTFEDQPLPNTGSNAWRGLWDAAQRFSTSDAYPGYGFPFTDEGSLCVFCQQELEENAAQRLQQFKDFLESNAQAEHDAAGRRYREKYNEVTELVVLDEAVEEAVNELEIEDAQLAKAVRSFLHMVETRRGRVREELSNMGLSPQDVPVSSFDVKPLLEHIENLHVRVRELRRPNQADAVRKLKNELKEIEARQVLAENAGEVLRAIERKKRIAAYQLCIEETRTNAITRKSSDVTRRAVTEQLAGSFTEELDALRFRHVEVQMVDSGGSRGALYHKLQLKRAPGVDVSKVVSEGEARCLSIASFFAELSTAADRSGILFDDPVSSLDHDWRDNVARRLVVEARERQVIVFTHDIVFLLALSQKAQALGVDMTPQYLRRDRAGAGLSSNRLPWPAMNIKQRIGHLKDLWQAAEKMERTESRERYEREAQYIYGLLREAWERGFEEVLLGGTVERYRKNVETQQAKKLADISAADCSVFEVGMEKCSRWLPGHDQAAAENAPVPDSAELEDDIKALEVWIGAIRKRRKK